MKVYEIIETRESLNEGFIDDILRSAKQKLMDKLMPAGGNARKTATVIGKLRSGSVDIMKLGALAAPILHYNQAMTAWNEQLASHMITDAEFKRHHDYEKGILWASMITAGAEFLADKGIYALSYLVGAIPILGLVLGPLMRFFTPELTVALLYYMNTAAGRELFAKFVGGFAIEEFGSFMPDAWDGIADMIRKVIKMTKEEIAELTGQPKPEEQPVDPNKPVDPNAPQPKPVDPNKPADPNAPKPAPTAEPEVDPASYANTNVPGSTYTPAGFKRDASGELDFK